MPDEMTIHYSYACAPCIERHIGPAFDRRFDHVPVATRDKCYGCGVANTDETPVFRFSYWFPWPDDVARHVEEASYVCKHCGRAIVNRGGAWTDPNAQGDDSVWAETCDAHDTFVADHEPED